MAAPSRLGTFLRAFTFGHVRQLTEAVLTRAWAAGAGPGAGPLVIDIDSTINDVHGKDKQGAAYGYTRVLGYHPIWRPGPTPARCSTSGCASSANSARGAERFVNEVMGRVRRAGATGPLVLRADSAYRSSKVIKACCRHDVRFSITVNQHGKGRHVLNRITTECLLCHPGRQAACVHQRDAIRAGCVHGEPMWVSSSGA